MRHLTEVPRSAIAPGEPQGARASLRVLVRACRPRQWAKNLLVLAAPSAAGVIDRPEVAVQVAGAFVVLCMLSSATYLVNDVSDRDQDRMHPRKRLRPVAAGDLQPSSALRWAAGLALAGVVLATVITPGLGLLACGYLVLTAAYSLALRGMAVLDILTIAAGFVVRAFAGGVASDIYLSRWFVIVTAACSMFLVAAKRYAELREQGPSQPMRASLRSYSLRGLGTVVALAAALGGIAYTGWAFTRPTHIVWYVASIVPFLAWFVRYGALIRGGAGQAPEELILRDRPLLALSLLWGALYLGGVYVGN